MSATHVSNDPAALPELRDVKFATDPTAMTYADTRPLFDQARAPKSHEFGLFRIAQIAREEPALLQGNVDDAVKVALAFLDPASISRSPSPEVRFLAAHVLEAIGTNSSLVSQLSEAVRMSAFDLLANLPIHVAEEPAIAGAARRPLETERGVIDCCQRSARLFAHAHPPAK